MTITFRTIDKTLIVTTDDGIATEYGPDRYAQYIIDTGRAEDVLAIQEPIPEPTQDELHTSIKNVRAAALEKFPRNSGVSTVYEQNFQAATLGAGDITTILRNGKTPAQHLTDFGVHLDMTADQFAVYVLAENLAAGQKMSEIEAQYLAVYYDGPLTEQSVRDYQAYCALRTAGY